MMFASCQKPTKTVMKSSSLASRLFGLIWGRKQSSTVESHDEVSAVDEPVNDQPTEEDLTFFKRVVCCMHGKTYALTEYEEELLRYARFMLRCNRIYYTGCNEQPWVDEPNHVLLNKRQQVVVVEEDQIVYADEDQFADDQEEEEPIDDIDEEEEEEWEEFVPFERYCATTVISRLQSIQDCVQPQDESSLLEMSAISDLMEESEEDQVDHGKPISRAMVSGFALTDCFKASLLLASC